MEKQVIAWAAILLMLVATLGIVKRCEAQEQTKGYYVTT